jgi:hypothetical protein
MRRYSSLGEFDPRHRDYRRQYQHEFGECELRADTAARTGNLPKDARPL